MSRSVASVAECDKPIRAFFGLLSLSGLSMQQFPLAADVNVTFPVASQGASEPLNQLTGQTTHPQQKNSHHHPLYQPCAADIIKHLSARKRQRPPADCTMFQVLLVVPRFLLLQLKFFLHDRVGQHLAGSSVTHTSTLLFFLR